MKKLFFLCVLLISTYGYSKAFIQALPFRAHFYKAPTTLNFDSYCPVEGRFEIENLRLLDSKRCNQKITKYINVRVLIKNEDDVIYINQDKTIVKNNQKCILTEKETTTIVEEVLKLTENLKRDCRQ